MQAPCQAVVFFPSSTPAKGDCSVFLRSWPSPRRYPIFCLTPGHLILRPPSRCKTAQESENFTRSLRQTSCSYLQRPAKSCQGSSACKKSPFRLTVVCAVRHIFRSSTAQLGTPGSCSSLFFARPNLARSPNLATATPVPQTASTAVLAALCYELTALVPRKASK